MVKLIYYRFAVIQVVLIGQSMQQGPTEVVITSAALMKDVHAR